MDTHTELAVLCRALLLGGSLGLVYDLMRVVRRRVPLPGLGGVLDFSFWVLATAALFRFSHEAWAGQVRLYGAVFCFLGGTAYFWGLSPPLLAVFLRVADICSFVLRILLFPLRAVRKILSGIGKNAKKTLFFQEKMEYDSVETEGLNS